MSMSQKVNLVYVILKKYKIWREKIEEEKTRYITERIYMHRGYKNTSEINI